MKIPGLEGFLRNRARARLRNVMRGYRILKKTDDLRRIAALREALTVTPVFLSQRNSESFAGLNGSTAEIAVRQFLLVRLVGTGLGAALLSSIGKHNTPVAYPLPSAWRKILDGQGFEVAERTSAFLWACVVALHFASGVFVVLKLTVASIQNLLRSANGTLKCYVYFDALGPGNLPPVGAAGEKNDIVSWYLRWSGRVPMDTVCHNVMAAGIRGSDGTAIVPISSPLLPFASLASLARFLASSAISLGEASSRALAGQWWHPIMLGEIAKAIHVRVQDPALLARDYLFHNSNWVYRPLWTHEAERQGARILFYFYSTNIEQFKQSGEYPEPLYGWRTMTWPKYLVWDSYQEAFVRRAVGDSAEIDIVGPIPFHSSVPAPQELPLNSIAVFDVQPMRNAVYQPLGIDIEYYVPRTASKFLTDIQRAAMDAGKVMLLKRKRDVGTRIHPGYVQTINWLSSTSNYLGLDPDISASALVERCQAVISTPFTSTAILGRELGKPSIYYDPHGVCEKDDRAAHGIPILSGQAELREWLRGLSSSSSSGLEPTQKEGRG
jgi:polysaccharide biosynthesis PFTS motif protein